ncbi:MAG: 16S rRNA (guanine(527)-N(7))-methyltransferase RsmG [Pseudomonadota bacterium]
MAEALGVRFNVSRETMKRLRDYVDLLLKWQSKINIIGPSTTQQVWDRHIADSLQLGSLALGTVPNGPICLLDLGSGAGLPGIPLGLLLAQERETFVHLVDSNVKKAAFLREALRVTGLNAQVHCVRIEQLTPAQTVPAPNIVVSRALASLDQLAEWALPWIEQGGACLLQKGRSVDKEMAATDQSHGLVYNIVPSELNPESCIVVVDAHSRGHR